MSFVVWHHAQHNTLVPSSIIWSPCRSDVILHITLGISTHKTCRVCLLNHDWAMQRHHVFTLSPPKIILPCLKQHSFSICSLRMDTPFQYQYVCAVYNFLRWATYMKYHWEFTILPLCFAF